MKSLKLSVQFNYSCNLSLMFHFHLELWGNSIHWVLKNKDLVINAESNMQLYGHYRNTKKKTLKYKQHKVCLILVTIYKILTSCLVKWWRKPNLACITPQRVRLPLMWCCLQTSSKHETSLQLSPWGRGIGSDHCWTGR